MKQYFFAGRVERVIDGDTFDITCDLGFSIYHRVRVRLRGVDTPEVYGPNATEEGKQVSQYVKGILEGKVVVIQTFKNSPSSFNRWEADVFFDLLKEDGSVEKPMANLAEHLVANNLVRQVLLEKK